MMMNVDGIATPCRENIARSRPGRLAWLALLGGTFVALTQQGLAQTAGPPAAAQASVGLEEIVVTAERRSENVQNVPIAITAFTSESLRSRNLTDVHALGNLSPGVNLDSGAPFSGDRSVLSASIRGIGQDDFAFNLNPGVGVYLDGVYLARTIGANQNLLDVDRVEILKGPQGTLFGANTEGGAISIITHTPGNEAKFVAQATGGSFNRRDFGFTADLPIIADTLLSSITVSSQVRDGYVKVIPYPTDSPQGATPFVVDPQTVYPKAAYQTSDNYGGYNVQTVRGKLLWNATDKLTVTTSVDWTHQDQTALPYTILGTYNGNLNASTFSTLYNLCISNSAASLPAAIAAAGGPPFFAGNCLNPRARVPGLSTGGAALIGAGYVGGPPGPYNAGNIAAGLPYLGSNSPRLYFDRAATDTGNIDTTYANGPDFARNDYFGGSVTANYALNSDMSVKSITGYRQINWLIGTDLDGTPETLQEVSDHQHQWQFSQEFQLNGKALDNALNYVAGLYYFQEVGYVHDYVPFESILYVYDFQNDANNRNVAAFVHADYRLGNFGFTAGGRYTDVNEKFIGGQGDLNGFPFGGGTVRYFPEGQNSQTWHIFDPTFGVQYHFNDDVMAYASWGKGFKAGGWTTPPVRGDHRRQGSRVPARIHQDLGTGPEVRLVRSSPAGQSGRLLYGLHRHPAQHPAGHIPRIHQRGQRQDQGGELELRSIVGGGFALNFSGSYIDAYYTYVNPNANIPQYALPDGSNVCPATALVGEPPHPVCAVVPPGITQLDAKLPKTPKYKLALFPSTATRCRAEPRCACLPTSPTRLKCSTTR